MTWSSEKLYFSPEFYIHDLLAEIGQAKLSIDIEMYIFTLDGLGRRILEALKQAANRGVRIRILVDGIGSPEWCSPALAFELKALEFRVFHPVPWPYSHFLPDELPRIGRSLRFFTKINRRNHKKVILIDELKAFVGSFNFHAPYLQWHETVACVEGDGISILKKAFEINWDKSYEPSKRKLHLSLGITKGSSLRFEGLRLNYPIRQRLYLRRQMYRNLKNAKRRIWIMTPYFLPGVKTTRILCRAAEEGVDVRIILPHDNDVLIIKWVTPMILDAFLKSGVRVFEYLPRMLHSKITLIDNWCVVGSANFNQRSHRLDLEADVVLGHPSSFEEIKKQFLKDGIQSIELDHKHLVLRPWWQKVLGRLFLVIRFML